MSKFAGLGLAVDKPSRMTIMHPTKGEPLCDESGKTAYIELLSTDSVALEEYGRELDARREAGGIPSPKQRRADNNGGIVALTKGWYLVDLDGKPIDIPFSPENARELYADNAVGWLREQVIAFTVNRANFLKA